MACQNTSGLVPLFFFKPPSVSALALWSWRGFPLVVSITKMTGVPPAAAVPFALSPVAAGSRGQLSTLLPHSQHSALV